MSFTGGATRPVRAGLVRFWAPALQHAREGAAVDQQALAGDVARLRRAQERASGTEFVGAAEALGRPLGLRLVVWDALGFGIGSDVRRQALGVEGARQQAIDGHVGGGD